MATTGNCASGLVVDTGFCIIGGTAVSVGTYALAATGVAVTAYLVACLIDCENTNENINNTATGVYEATGYVIVSTGEYIMMQQASFDAWKTFEFSNDRAKLLALTAMALSASGIDPDDIDTGKKQQNNSELNKSRNSLEKRLNEHKAKLESYKKDPYSMDNKDMLNSNNINNQNTIINNRIAELEKQIETFSKQIKEIDLILKSRM